MFAGIYSVLPTPGRAGHVRPIPGQIVRHIDGHGQPTNNWRLCCPACGKRVHIYAKQIGAPEAPTFDAPLRCGCTARCGVWFRITAGRAVPCDPPGKAGEDIMREATAIPGVHVPPRRA
jgi:hypothetical protein